MKKLTILLVLLLGLSLLAGCGSSDSDVVASVNGEEITQEQLDKKVNEVKAYYEQQGLKLEGEQGKELLENIKQQILEDMINEKVLMQEAQKQGEKLTEQQIEEKISTIKEQFPSEEAFKKYLEQAGKTEKELVYLVNLNEKVLKDVQPPTEAEAKEYYEQNINQFTVPEQYQVRHILIAYKDPEGNILHSDAEAEKLAVQVLAEVKSGKDFAGLAKEKSEDPGLKDNGGLYTFQKGQAVSEFEQAALALKPGEITKRPVKTEFGYHIIKKEKEISAQKKPFEEVEGNIMQTLDQQAKQAKFASYMEDVKKKAKIINKLAPSGDNKSKK